MLKRVRIRPRKIGRVCFRIKVGERVCKLDLEIILIIVPGQETLTPLPFHGVGADAVDWPETHFVEFTLLCHSLDVKNE